MNGQEPPDGSVALILLARLEVMRMVDAGGRLVGDLVATGDETCRHEHVLVGLHGLEAARLEVGASTVGGAGVGGKEGLDAVRGDIVLAAYVRLVRVVELADELLHASGSGFRKLAPAHESYARITFHRRDEANEKAFVCGYDILRHKADVVANRHAKGLRAASFRD